MQCHAIQYHTIQHNTKSNAIRTHQTRHSALEEHYTVLYFNKDNTAQRGAGAGDPPGSLLSTCSRVSLAVMTCTMLALCTPSSLAMRSDAQLIISYHIMTTSARSPTHHHTTPHHSTAQHTTPHHTTPQHTTPHHTTAQHSTPHHSTAQHSTSYTTQKGPSRPRHHGCVCVCVCVFLCVFCVCEFVCVCLCVCVFVCVLCVCV